ncbi:hypothetical protein Tco_0311629 [Tanacetum coccineum]
MLADSLLPTIFWVEAVNTACYVQNRVLVTKPYNKTSYKLLHEDTTDLLNTGIFSGAYDDEDVGAEADLNNLETTMNDEKQSCYIFGLCKHLWGLLCTDGCKELPLYGTIEGEVYVDDIIFGSTKKYLCVEFEQMMHKRFQMSSMRELTFFLGLQQTIVANSTTEAEYVAAANCCGQGFGAAGQKSERASKHSYDSPLLGVNTPGSDEERFEQHELTDNIPPTPHDSPLPGGHTLGSDEGRLQQEKLMNIVTALSQKVEGLESDLKKTKKLYATAFKMLINKVKSLKDELKFQKSKSKRRRLTLVISEDEEDLVAKDPSKQGRKGFGDSQEVSTAAQEVSTAVSTASPQRNADTTADDLTLVETLIEIRKSAAKDKGKDKMDETESPRKMKQRESGFTDAEWDDILIRVAAYKDFVQQLQEGEKCSEEDLPMKLVELVNQRKKLKMRRVQSFVPMDSELEVQRLKRAGQEVSEKPVKRQKIREASESGSNPIIRLEVTLNTQEGIGDYQIWKPTEAISDFC